MRPLLLAAALAACTPPAEVANNASPGTQDRRVGRDHYSAKVASDPYVLDQQRAVAEALRRSCEEAGEHCALANGAERYIDEHDARR